MKIELVLTTDDEDMVDEDHSTGLTEDANERLTDALIDAGFSIESGPDKA